MSITVSFISTLPNLSLIKLAGEQRHEYLHGQLTVATKNFDTKFARLAALCDFKGKMFSALIVSEFDGAFLLAAQKDAAQESLNQLKKYGVFSKVDIAFCEDLKAYGGFGAEAFDKIKALFKDLDDTHMSASTSEFGQVIVFNDNTLRFVAYLNKEGQSRLQDLYEHDIQDQSFLFEALEIEAGLANVQAETLGEFVPQMLNFQALNAIDFDKGCYMGQEVVARTKFLGKNKRATFILSGLLKGDDDSEVFKVGSALERQLGGNWRRNGVINRVSVVDKHVHLLAVMAKDTEMDSQIRVKDSNIVLNIQALPYALEE